MIAFTSFLVLASLPQAPHAVEPVAKARAPYRALTDTRRSFTNRNVEAVRGFVATNDGSELYALNVDQSTIVAFAAPLVQPFARWRTLAEPCAIAFDGPDLLVVGQGNHAIARHSRTTGAMLDVLALPSEPADLVVDPENHEAWVSCMGADRVVQIALGPPFAIVRTYGVADGLLAKRPRNLSIDLGDPQDPSDSVVYVAPLVSGNNTMITTQLPGGSALRERVVDGYDASGFPSGGLPDVDLFRIRRASGVVERVVRKAGSLMLAHGKNPATGDYWMLGVDEHNLLATNEPAIRGRFATNALSIVRASSWPGAGAGPVLPDLHRDLDDDTPDDATPTHSSTSACAFPCAIAFHASTGWAAIAGSGSPRILLCDQDGARRQTLSLDDAALGIHGRVVRTLRIVQGTQLLAYCQQTNEILVYSLAPLALVPTRSIALGDDPAPASVKRGRAIWYDASRSTDARTSCNTCHPQGGSDGLVWQISNAPVDEKGPMVTQPLLGLEDSFPYHWRGERSLDEFNDAFPGLLGASAALPPAELDDFLEFLFSLVPPANPSQDVDRELKDALRPMAQGVGVVPLPRVGSPVRGSALYHDRDADGLFGNGSCASCHMDPTGSRGDYFADKPSPVASASNFETIQLDAGLALKDQPLVDVAVDPVAGAGASSFKSQLLGSGVLHDGRSQSLFTFVLAFFPTFNAQEKADVVSFVQLFDTGTAPATHFVARLDASTSETEARRLRKLVASQTSRGWIGVVALTTWDVGGVPTRIAWWWDAASAHFVPEDASLASAQTFAQFVAAASSGSASITLLGVEPGNERRLAADNDLDGLDSGVERALGTDPWRADTDRDGAPDGDEVANGSDPLDASSLPNDATPPQLVGPIEIDFVNASQVKLHFRSDEPARWSIALATPNGRPVSEARLSLDVLHTAVVHRLEPSTEGFHANGYTGTLVLTDRAGNASAPIALPPFDTASMIHEATAPGVGVDVVVGDLALTQESRAGSTWSARADVRVDWREHGPPAIGAPSHVVVAQLMKRAANGLDWEIVPASNVTHDAPNAPSTSFLFDGVPYSALPGPFVVLAPTDASGRTSVHVAASGLAPGEEVLFDVLAVLPAPAGYAPASPAFVGPNQRRYVLPATASSKRAVKSTL